MRSGKTAPSSYHSGRPRKRNCYSITCSSNCVRFNPARALLGLPVWSWSIRRSASYPLQVGNGILARLRSRAFPARSLGCPPGEQWPH